MKKINLGIWKVLLSLVKGVIIAIVSVLSIVFLASIIFGGMFEHAFWVYVSCLAFFCAIMWMNASLRSGKVTFNRTFFYIILGIVMSWIVLISVLSDGYILWGIFPFVCSIIGGTLGGWFLLRKTPLSQGEVTTWMLFPVIVIAIVFTVYIRIPAIGSSISVRHDNRQVQARTIYSGSCQDILNSEVCTGGWVLWISNSEAKMLFKDTNHVLLEIEYNSQLGPETYDFRKVANERILQRVKMNEYYEKTQSLQSQVEQGQVPPWYANLNLPTPDFSRGVVLLEMIDNV